MKSIHFQIYLTILLFKIMKILTDSDFAKLKSKAAFADVIFAKIQEADAEFKAEDATPESVLELLAGSNTEELNQANSKITELENELSEKETSIAELEEKVETLEKAPAGQSAGKTPPVEENKSSDLDSVVAFTDKSTDTMANVEKVRELLK